MIDAIVVGSGPSGANAAAALLEGGARVRVLDFGVTDARYESIVPDRPFTELRRTDPEQHQYFLGRDFEGIPSGAVREVAQLTPPRMFALRGALEKLPIRSASFRAAESLALGGLGAAWGAGVFPFNDDELAEMPLRRRDLQPHYERVAARIGVAGDVDDLSAFYGPLAARQPGLETDTHAELILARYSRRRPRELTLGRTWLAALSQPLGDRRPNPYHDMDFWTDRSRSVYRPRFTIEALQRDPRCEYVAGSLVRIFREVAGGVEVVTENPSGGQETHQARSLVLAAGTLSTARIVLASLGRFGERRPLVCNPYSYVPFVHLDLLGKPTRDRRHSLAQLTGVLRDDAGYVQVQVYSYRSLLTFRLLPEAPIGTREALSVLTELLPLFGILGVSHADRRSPDRWLRLPESGPLEIEYRLSDEEERRRRRATRRVLRTFLGLRCLPIGEIAPGHGASVHYAGCFPMSSEGEALTTAQDGRLRGTRSVYVADGSIFSSLPPKGLTFTMMAHADRLGQTLARRLGREEPR